MDCRKNAKLLLTCGFLHFNMKGEVEIELFCTAGRDGQLLCILRGEMGLSASLVKRLKKQNAIFVENEPAWTDRLVRKGEVVRVVIWEALPDFPLEKGQLDVLYEDEAILAVDKPAGVWVHPTPGRQTGTLANRVAYYLRNEGSSVHVVTRLDRDTFGVVLFAKNGFVHAQLSRMLQQGGMEKCYHAVVCGLPEQREGVIDLPIARRTGGSLLREVRSNGQSAVTCYHVVSTSGGLSLLALKPETGRTHQLRVHCAAIGCPILGDRAYGNNASAALSDGFGITTQQLCAVSLRFAHPLSGEPLTISSQQSPIFPKLTVETSEN